MTILSETCSLLTGAMGGGGVFQLLNFINTRAIEARRVKAEHLLNDQAALREAQAVESSKEREKVLDRTELEKISLQLIESLQKQVKALQDEMAAVEARYTKLLNDEQDAREKLERECMARYQQNQSLIKNLQDELSSARAKIGDLERGVTTVFKTDHTEVTTIPSNGTASGG